MQAASWRNVTVSRNHLCSSAQFADFHSTPITLAKWKSKWDCKGEQNGQKPSKTYIRYAVRQRRAEEKKALKDYLLYGKSSDLHFQDPSDSYGSDNIPRFKCYGKSRLHNSSHCGKGKNSGSKYIASLRTVSSPLCIHCRSLPYSHKILKLYNWLFFHEQCPEILCRKWIEMHNYSSHDFLKDVLKFDATIESSSYYDSCTEKRQCFYDFYNENEFVHPEMIFEAVFGRHRGFTWSYTSAGNFHFNNSTSGFRWTDESSWEKTRKRFWHASDDDESTNVGGSHAHRAALGLPLTGQLNLDDVKCAFRASALKWHPDKHQGSSQAMAEERFKLCVDAYNSLCSALKST